MAISSLLGIAQRALLASETALGVVGNNIANVNTPGYTRQVPDLESDPSSVTAQGVLVGTGVHVAAVRQVLDPLLEKRLLGAETERRQQGAVRDQLSALTSSTNPRWGTRSTGSLPPPMRSPAIRAALRSARPFSARRARSPTSSSSGARRSRRSSAAPTTRTSRPPRAPTTPSAASRTSTGRSPPRRPAASAPTTCATGVARRSPTSPA